MLSDAVKFPEVGQIAQVLAFTRPYLLMLVGPPGSGKTTFRHELLEELRGGRGTLPVIVSSDDAVQDHADMRGITYAKAFAEMGSRAVPQTEARFQAAVREGRSIILDQTNLSVKSRARKLKALEQLAPVGVEYAPLCVNFLTEPLAIQKRLAERGERGADYNVYLKMKSSYQAPREDEGFHRVWGIFRFTN